MISILTTLVLASHLLQKPMIVTQTNPNAPIDPTDQKQVVRIFEHLDNAWNAHDMDAYVDLMTDDCQWVNVVGMWWNGKESIKRAHIAFHKTMFKDVSNHTESLSLRQIAPGVIGGIAVSHVGSYKTPDGNLVPEGTYRLSATLVNRQGIWKIAGAQVTPINVMAARFDPGAPQKPLPSN